MRTNSPGWLGNSIWPTRTEQTFSPLMTTARRKYSAVLSLWASQGPTSQTFTSAPTSPGTCRRASTKGSLCSNSLTPCTVQGYGSTTIQASTLVQHSSQLCRSSEIPSWAAVYRSLALGFVWAENSQSCDAPILGAPCRCAAICVLVARSPSLEPRAWDRRFRWLTLQVWAVLCQSGILPVWDHPFLSLG